MQETSNPPRRRINPVVKTVLGIFLLAFVFGSGFGFGRLGYRISLVDLKEVKVDRDIPHDKAVDFSMFWKVWDTLGESYLDKTKLVPQELVYGAIKGMVAAVGDPYTVFLSPRENEVTQEDLNGSFEGVGIQIGFKGNQLAVIAPLPGTPAEKAGLRAGDFIVGIKDDQKGLNTGTVGLSLPEAVQAIRGPKGSVVTLYITRDGLNETLEIDVTRENIDVPSVIAENIETDGKTIAHIKVLKFGSETLAEWNEAVSKAILDEVDGIVLDLRNNPGGYLQAAVDIAGSFLDNGSVAVLEEDASGKRFEYKTQGLPKLKNFELILLVNEGSASASEILAGALRDLLGTKLVGDKTFGKGTIQEPLQMEKGSGLHITIAKWLTPNGTWVNDTEGLNPDVAVADDPETPDDEQLQVALDTLGI